MQRLKVIICWPNPQTIKLFVLCYACRYSDYRLVAMKKSNFKGIIYGLLLYISVGIIAIFWLLVANVVVPESDNRSRLISLMMNAGVISWWGAVFLVLEGILAYYSGRTCAEYSIGDGSQKPAVLGFLMVVPAIVLGAIFVGLDKIYEVAIICVIALVACTSGHDSYIDV